jgi:SnoaL-like polyketide cyclase
VSENLRIPAECSAAMEPGDTDAVYKFWVPDFEIHVTSRVTPERIGEDVRGEEQKWWEQARGAFPDMTFTVNLVIESDDPVVQLDDAGHPHLEPFYDVEPSGNPVTINGTAILRMGDGLIAEHWRGPHCQEGLGLIR